MEINKSGKNMKKYIHRQFENKCTKKEFFRNYDIDESGEITILSNILARR